MGGEGSYNLLIIKGRHGDIEGEGSKVEGGGFLFRVLSGVKIFNRFLIGVRGGLCPADVFFIPDSNLYSSPLLFCEVGFLGLSGFGCLRPSFTFEGGGENVNDTTWGQFL